jgi:glycosyltransferase involved in cell wall biosynthesis
VLALDHSIFSLQAAGGISKWWLMHTLCMEKQYGPAIFHLGPYSNRNIHLAEIPSSGLPASSAKLPVLWPWRPVSVPANTRVFHSSYLRTCSDYRKVAAVFTFHDDFWLGGPSMKSRLKKACVARCLSQSRLVHCVSNYSKSLLLERFPSLPGDRVRVVYHGVAPPGELHPVAVAERIAGNYVLWVGNRHLYKNGSIALAAAAKLPNVHLICVGGEPLSADELTTIRDLDLAPRFHHLQGITTKQLDWLYANALALWYPSLLEGFGLPVIEAAARGCPVLAAAGHAVEEIGRGWPLLTARPTAEWLAGETARLGDDHSMRRRLTSEGIELARHYTWERYTEEMTAVYAELRAIA